MPPLANVPGLAARFWAKVDATGDCWEWTGGRDSGGYGAFGVSRKRTGAHRVVWEVLVGPIPPGMEVDHLCFNTGCVNPDHLEPVTQVENLLRRRWNITHMLAARTHCPQGHPYDEENTWITTSGTRSCRACGKIRAKAKRARNRPVDQLGRGKWRTLITDCPQGHPYSEENTWFYGRAGRQCKTCARARAAARSQAKKAAKLAATG